MQQTFSTWHLAFSTWRCPLGINRWLLKACYLVLAILPTGARMANCQVRYAKYQLPSASTP